MTEESKVGNTAAGGEVFQKCPCCNNPWSLAVEDMIAAMMMCRTCEEDSSKNAKAHVLDRGIDLSDMDESKSPAENFFYYANGGWIQKNPIPSGYPSWNTFTQLHVASQERLRDLLNDSNSNSNEKDDDAKEQKKVALFYAAAMDEQAIERADDRVVLKPALDACEEIVAAAAKGRNGDPGNELATALGKLVAEFGVYPFFSIGASPDNKNSDHSICQLSQGGLGLPDRDYYFDDDKEEKRVAYKKHVAKMLSLLDDLPSEEAANAIYDLEKKIAEAHMTKTENRDPEATYNKMSVQDLTVQTCHDKFDFTSYFLAATDKDDIGGLGEINVRNVAALERVAETITDVEPTVLRHYLRWRTVQSCAKYLSKAFVDEDFDFNERILSGTQEMKPRWKRAMAFTESALGEALGKMYCQKYFDESCKERALSLVENVRQALENRLKEVEWMASKDTREAALKKMSRFKVKIGYPDEWIDHSPLNFVEGEDFLSMVFKSRRFHHKREVKEMNAPTDRKKWYLTPQTVNAYYSPSLNEIVFPAGILQAPFFNPNADDAVNYGSMGAVVGHEMTHGFDDKGRKFDADGNMMDWWSMEDSEEYEKRVAVMVKQANEYKVHGQSVQGKLTCGENIADLGGVRLAYRALKSTSSFNDNVVIDGLTPTQRFFLGWAQCWRQNITTERSLQLLTLDPHGPNEMRCNGTLSNIPEFYDAFQVPTSSPMYRPSEDRVDIW